jgi:outer membrane lipoprotein SlyB
MRRADGQPLRIVASFILLIGSVALLNGCETLERTIKDNPRTAAGAGAGAAGGAVIGGLASGGTGAVIGGLAGVLAGGVIGSVLDRQERTRAATAETMAYSVEKGNLVRIEEVSLNPQSIRPGETVNVNVQYAIITPGGRDPVRVREVRQIYYQGDLVGNPVVEIERLDGTYWSTLPIKLPASATPGLYTVVVGVEMNGTLDRWESRFNVIQ